MILPACQPYNPFIKPLHHTTAQQSNRVLGFFLPLDLTHKVTLTLGSANKFAI